MASAVNNLRINGVEVKTVLFKTANMPNYIPLSEFYYNNILVWKNANPFLFVQNIETIDLTTLSPDTLIFENFSDKNFSGSYNTIENILEKPTQVGQMVVIKTADGDE